MGMGEKELLVKNGIVDVWKCEKNYQNRRVWRVDESQKKLGQQLELDMTKLQNKMTTMTKEMTMKNDSWEKW